MILKQMGVFKVKKIYQKNEIRFTNVKQKTFMQ